MYTIDEVYALAVQIEKNGESFYREGLKEVSDPQVKALLERLADDEKDHIETFTRMREALNQNPLVPLAAEQTNALLNILGDQSFSLKETDLSGIEQERLIQAALEFEKDTILFYELLRSLTLDAATIAQLDRILLEERRHVEVLEKMKGQT